ncbi:DUF732 domain-containing protein [Mycobacterium yunnanensis]|uniref:DUF732 domain-containing protein n=1 Tax=Mycobacterium yunnanensis TaxID=368477 RepID=A0A9X2ZBL8_9MYCO|nr:DUF732 domain-containing protein [Mycobacterium yunnanensis]MCV7424781.1 DUF732 domain-containing protein [Mycobacterium yunnanensis]
MAAISLAAIVAGLSCAPSAMAEPRDDFLDELATLNVILPGATQTDTMQAGYYTCDSLRHGVTVLDAMDAAERDFRLSPGQGTLFVSAATTNLCPDFAG